MILQLAALGAIGFLGYRYFTRDTRDSSPAFAKGQVGGSHTDIRDAGPEAMRDPTGRPWTATDEAVDGSFPASDPPGGY